MVAGLIDKQTQRGSATVGAALHRQIERLQRVDAGSDPRIWAFAAFYGALALFLTLASTWINPIGTGALPDFSIHPAGPERKRAFFGYLGPVIAAKNTMILEERRRLEHIAGKLPEGIAVGPSDSAFLDRLARRYRIKDAGGLATSALVAELLLRVDTIPVSLALIQAAKESGWGTSRFAQTNNNLFGQWCFTPGCGEVPKNRPEGASHEVQSFSGAGAAIESYLMNLNTHPSYESVRTIRARHRARGNRANGTALADGLIKYSERREAYVAEIKAMISGNQAFIAEATASAAD